MKKIYFIFSLNNQIIRFLKNLSTISENYSIISITSSIKTNLVSKNISTISITDYEINTFDDKEIYAKTINWLNSCPQTLIGDKKLVEWTVYENINYWQFVPAEMYRIIQHTITGIELITNILTKEKSDEIVILGNTANNHQLTYQCIKVITQTNKIKFRELYPATLNLDILKNRLKTSRWFILFHHRIIDNLAKLMYKISQIFPARFTDKKGSKRILAISYKRNWKKIYDSLQKRYLDSDEEFHYLYREIKKVNKQIDFLGIETFYSGFYHPGKTLIDRLLNTIQDNLNIFKVLYIKIFIQPFFPWKPFVCYTTKLTGINKIKAKIYFTRIWDKLSKIGIGESLIYQNIPVGRIIENELNKIFTSLFPEMISLVNTAQNMIYRENPDLIVSVYETGPFARAINIAASIKNVPTIGIQHGIIHTLHPDYMHRLVTTDIKKEPLGFIIPQYTFVYGNNYKSILTGTGTYLPENVIVTGTLKHDLLVNLNKFTDKRKILTRYHLDSGKKIILFIGDAAYDTTQRITAVITALNQLYDVQLIIKPHPGESVNFYRKAIRSLSPVRFPIYIITTGLYELLYVSDLILVSFSTVSLEAMLIDKIVLLLKFYLGGEDSPLVQSGMPVVTDQHKLTGTIQTILNFSVEEKQQILNKTRTFVHNYIDNLDGNASKRTINIINQILNI